MVMKMQVGERKATHPLCVLNCECECGISLDCFCLFLFVLVFVVLYYLFNKISLVYALRAFWCVLYFIL